MTASSDLQRGRKRGRQRQNYVVLQQLANGQSLITLPTMWVELLKLSKGDLVTFVPGTHGGLELVPAKKNATKQRHSINATTSANKTTAQQTTTKKS